MYSHTQSPVCLEAHPTPLTCTCLYSTHTSRRLRARRPSQARVGNDKNQAGTANPDVPDYTTQSMSYPAEGLHDKRVDDKNEVSPDRQ